MGSSAQYMTEHIVRAFQSLDTKTVDAKTLKQLKNPFVTAFLITSKAKPLRDF